MGQPNGEPPLLTCNQNNGLGDQGSFQPCHKKQRKIGPLTTEEISTREKFCLKRAQSDVVNTTKFSEDQLRLNLQKNKDGLFECRGRIQGEYPIYVPCDHVLARNLVEEVHLRTLHGGVGMTMAGIREKYWIPKLR